jgi:undecaprenyl-diphosphatase
MTILEGFLIALIEGLTEFLPVSSTGHMILLSRFFEIHDDEFVKTFEVFIQTGAILAIAIMYIKKFLQGIDVYLKLGVAFLPIAVFGFLGYDLIKNVLFSPVVVAVSLIIGGLVLILVDKKVVSQKSRYEDITNISFKDSLFIGFWQCFALIPGVSRAAASIVGGVFNGFDKKQATEFSFLLALPTVAAAAGYDLLKTNLNFSSREYMLLSMGLVVAFISAWFAVKIFLKIVENYGFKHFGYYRIILGALFLYFYL